MRALGATYSESGTWHCLAFAGWSACRCRVDAEIAWNSSPSQNAFQMFPVVLGFNLQTCCTLVVVGSYRWYQHSFHRILHVFHLRWRCYPCLAVLKKIKLFLGHCFSRTMEFCYEIKLVEKSVHSTCYLLSCCTKGNASAILSAGVSLHIAAISFHVAAGLIGEEDQSCQTLSSHGLKMYPSKN